MPRLLGRVCGIWNRINNYHPDDYAWILTNPRLIKPFPVKGKQSLWTCEHEIGYLPVSEMGDDEIRQKYWDPITDL